MKKKRFAEQEIIGFLKGAETGRWVRFAHRPQVKKACITAGL